MKLLGRSSWWGKFLRLLTFALVVSGVSIFGVLNYAAYRFTRNYIHPPRVSAAGDFLRAGGVSFSTIYLTTEDGIRLRAFYVPSQNGAVILLAHGHSGTIDEQMVALFARNGFGVVAWDFRAHGESGGTFSSFGYYEALDVKTALDFALAQPGVRRVGILGSSMGAAAAIHAAARYPQIEAVVADSAFDTLEGVFDMRLPDTFLRPLARFYGKLETGMDLDDFRPVDEIGKISPRPVFIIQGQDDKNIPPQSAQRLYDAASQPKYIWVGEEAGHVMMSIVYAQEYETRVIDFFNSAFWGSQ